MIMKNDVDKGINIRFAECLIVDKYEVMYKSEILVVCLRDNIQYKFIANTIRMLHFK